MSYYIPPILIETAPECGPAPEYRLPDCENTLRIQTGWPDSDFIVELEDKFGHRYVQSLLTDSNGYAFFDYTGYPPATFTSFSGPIKYRIYEPLDDLRTKQFPIKVETPPAEPAYYLMGIFTLITIF